MFLYFGKQKVFSFLFAVGLQQNKDNWILVRQVTNCSAPVCGWRKQRKKNLMEKVKGENKERKIRVFW